MKLDSKLFDRIRIKPEEPPVVGDEPCCEWDGCRSGGAYRAPKGRHQEGKYFHFCLDHVRQYNKSYNYFAGMADDDIAAYQKASATGHRPTWTMGVNAAGEARREARSHHAPEWRADNAHDQFGMFGGRFRSRPEAEEPRRALKNLERRAFDTLDLEGTESGPEIKGRYKALVKRLHPDANGGDRSSEDRLREIIQAYNYLKTAGFC